MNFEFIQSETDLDRLWPAVKPLWLKLTALHAEQNPEFSEFFSSLTFEKRMENLKKKTQNGKIRLELVRADETAIAYCSSSLTEGIGEIDSIFVEDAYRNQKIGDALVSRALVWFDAHSAKRKLVHVAYQNKKARRFYERYGFIPRSYTLEQP